MLANWIVSARGYLISVLNIRLVRTSLHLFVCFSSFFENKLLRLNFQDKTCQEIFFVYKWDFSGMDSYDVA